MFGFSLTLGASPPPPTTVQVKEINNQFSIVFYLLSGLLAMATMHFVRFIMLCGGRTAQELELVEKIRGVVSDVVVDAVAAASGKLQDCSVSSSSSDEDEDEDEEAEYGRLSSEEEEIDEEEIYEEEDDDEDVDLEELDDDGFEFEVEDAGLGPECGRHLRGGYTCAAPGHSLTPMPTPAITPIVEEVDEEDYDMFELDDCL